MFEVEDQMQDLLRCDCMFVPSHGVPQDQCLQRATQDDGLCDDCRLHQHMREFTRASPVVRQSTAQETRGEARRDEGRVRT